MAFKDILVYLDPSPASDDRIRFAVDLAKTHSARLFGVDVSSDEAFLGEWRERALEIQVKFEEAARQSDVTAQYVGLGDREHLVAPDRSHCVDLIIAPQPGPDARPLIKSFVPEEAVLASGAPTLVLPQDWKFGPVGDNIVIAWNASREAARAAHDALPLLQRAKKVVIFAFSPGPSGLKASAELLADHLLRHGVTAQISDWTNTGDATAVDALFASLDTQDADLIVAGAFGHSHVFESLFGGVSQDLLRQPTLPVLMSH